MIIINSRLNEGKYFSKRANSFYGGKLPQRWKCLRWPWRRNEKAGGGGPDQNGHGHGPGLSWDGVMGWAEETQVLVAGGCPGEGR